MSLVFAEGHNSRPQRFQ